MHDLVRLYGIERANAHEMRENLDTPLLRLADFLLHTAHAADQLLAEHRRVVPIGEPVTGAVPAALIDEGSALAWFEAEHLNLLLVQVYLRDQQQHGRSWQIAWALDNYHWRRGHVHDDVSAWLVGLHSTVELGSQFAEGLARRRLGRAYGRVGDYSRAVEQLNLALPLMASSNDAPGQAHTYRILA